MKRIILSIFVICIMAVFVSAESCTTVGEIGKKYTPEGDCNYKTQTRTCCENKQWSEWGKECTPSPSYKDCEDGESGTGSVELWGSSAEWSGKVVGSKTCRRVCKNGKWEYSLQGISCGSGQGSLSYQISGCGDQARLLHGTMVQLGHDELCKLH